MNYLVLQQSFHEAFYIKGKTPEMLIGVHEERNYITRDEINEITEAIKIELREELTKSISNDVTRNMYSGFAAAFMKDAAGGNVGSSQVMELD